MMGTTFVIEALSLNYGRAFGFQEYLLNILNYFKEHRDEIRAQKILIVCKSCDSHAFRLSEPEMEVISFEVKNTLHRYLILNTLSQRLHLSKDDIILYTNNYGALTKRCKYLLVIHDLLYLRKEYMPNRWFRLQRSLFVPRSARIADRVIGISNWVKKDIVAQFGVSESKVVAIYNYFNFEKFNGEPNKDVVDAVKGKKYFLVVCSSAYHKNTITTLKAYCKYVEKGGKTSLVAVGRFSEELENYLAGQPADIRNRIVNLNGISNASLAYLYKNAEAYISATLFEGLGMPIVEALYFNTPCILSDIEVVREVSNDMATYFPAMDADRLCECLQQAEKKAKTYSREVIEEKFAISNTVARYVDLINAATRSKAINIQIVKSGGNSI